MTTPRFQRSQHAISSEVGRDIVALNVERGAYYGMEQVTATVWQLLSAPLTLDQLCEKLMAVYEIDPATCRTDVGALLREFEDEGLVERVGAA